MVALRLWAYLSRLTPLGASAITGNESVPKIIMNDTTSLFFKLQSAFC